MTEKNNEIKHKIKKVLDKDRYQHTLGVAYTATCLAMRYQIDLDDAFTAGLLHDCAKCIPTAEKLEICKKNGIELTEIEIKNPALIHAKLGAFLAKDKYGITDKDILASIRTHTTGEPGMSLLQKIIFIADYIEPRRDQANNLAEIRKLAFIDLDLAVRRVLHDTLNYLNKKTAVVDPQTSKTYEYYCKITDTKNK
ncbi:MAG: bis(5'-nucleosyl)-tetraphosphatase (symmetrical) YqeK [Lachnospiraceae bacterium]|nr:bis(5'-nucleosyl)-tetraphosphatase (symmetrical) YqeK [Lachnospiraceae bacterium]